MIFSSDAANDVYGSYERRIAEEERKVATLGREAMGRRDEFLLAVGPEVGAFLHSLVLARRPARVLELGTSYGYSTLFLADAVRQVGGRLITMELADYKQASARESMERAKLAEVIDFRLGDAVAMIAEDDGPFDLVLIDIWKELYVPCLNAVDPKLSDEGIIAADNIIHPPLYRDSARDYRAAVRALPDMQTVLLPIGSGIELSVRWSTGNRKL